MEKVFENPSHRKLVLGKQQNSSVSWLMAFLVQHERERDESV